MISVGGWGVFRGGVGGVQGEGLGCCQGCFLEAGGHIPETQYICRKSDGDRPPVFTLFGIYLGHFRDAPGTVSISSWDSFWDTPVDPEILPHV